MNRPYGKKSFRIKFRLTVRPTADGQIWKGVYYTDFP